MTRAIALGLALTLAGALIPAPALALRTVGLEENEDTRQEVIAALAGSPKPVLPHTGWENMLKPDVARGILEVIPLPSS